MNLVEKAQLTEAEIGSLAAWRAVSSHEFYADQRLIAAAQLAKALWAVADWLEEYSENLDVFERNGVDGAAGALRRLAKEAGMTEPKP